MDTAPDVQEDPEAKALHSNHWHRLHREVYHLDDTPGASMSIGEGLRELLPMKLSLLQPQHAGNIS